MPHSTSKGNHKPHRRCQVISADQLVRGQARGTGHQVHLGVSQPATAGLERIIKESHYLFVPDPVHLGHSRGPWEYQPIHLSHPVQAAYRLLSFFSGYVPLQKVGSKRESMSGQTHSCCVSWGCYVCSVVFHGVSTGLLPSSLEKENSLGTSTVQSLRVSHHKAQHPLNRN